MAEDRASHAPAAEGMKPARSVPASCIQRRKSLNLPCVRAWPVERPGQSDRSGEPNSTHAPGAVRLDGRVGRAERDPPQGATVPSVGLAPLDPPYTASGNRPLPWKRNTTPELTGAAVSPS